MDEKVESALCRVIQECLTSIQRHSGSKTARICIINKKGELVAEVQSFGKGLELKNKEHGIAGMRKGVPEVDGSLGDRKW